MWNHQNFIKANGSVPDEESLLYKIYFLGEEFGVGVGASIPPQRLESQLSQGSWFPPEDGFCKLNIDASRSDHEGAGGISWIIRDSTGFLVLCKL